MATPFTGGCVCGALRYECSAEPAMAGNCHCRDCQRATGGAFAPGLLVPRAAVKVSGDMTYYEVKADSGNTVSRGFCPKCGARVLFSNSTMSELIGIMAGSLDDPSWCRPAVDLYTASAQPWDYMNPDLPKFPHMPPMN